MSKQQTSKPTVASVRTQLRDLGIKFKSLPETGEYLVNGSYYTDCLQDALDTGKYIAVQTAYQTLQTRGVI